MTPEIAWRFYPLVANHPAARAFVESLAKRQRAAKTIDAYARNLEDFLRTWPGASPERVLEANAADLDDYLAQLYTRLPARASRTNNLPHDTRLSDATVQQRLVTVRLFYDFCLQRGLRQNPISQCCAASARVLIRCGACCPDDAACRGSRPMTNGDPC